MEGCVELAIDQFPSIRRKVRWDLATGQGRTDVIETETTRKASL